MQALHIVPLHRCPQLLEEAAQWFHKKWNISLQAYRESMQAACAPGAVVPRWYLALQGETLVAGAGVIENDFHLRRDLTPNLCALYVEIPHRGQGIAGALLAHICADMAAEGIDTLYLVSDHIGFYERYGWEYIGQVPETDGGLTRMYRHVHKNHEADTEEG